MLAELWQGAVHMGGHLTESATDQLCQDVISEGIDLSGTERTDLAKE